MMSGALQLYDNNIFNNIIKTITIQRNGMMTVDEYRAAILDAMLQLKDNEGNARITEADAKDILKGFTDDELNDGILFNTPEEVAELLAEGV